MADPVKAATSATPAANPFLTALYFATESVVPGSSQALRGDVRGGVLYGLAGLAAMVAFGGTGRLLVGASSLVKSVHGADVLALAGLRSPSTGS